MAGATRSSDRLRPPSLCPAAQPRFLIDASILVCEDDRLKYTSVRRLKTQVYLNTSMIDSSILEYEDDRLRVDTYPELCITRHTSIRREFDFGTKCNLPRYLRLVEVEVTVTLRV